MARSEARLAVTIWNDRDFLALTPGAQRLFMFLLSQPDLAHTGVLALRERRWSKAAAGLTTAQVSADLTELDAARFVIVDDDAEELLIRSFIRRDKVYRQPNVLRAAADAIGVITSPRILAALAAELRRIATAEDIGKGSASIVAEMLDSLGNPPENPSPNPSQKGSGDPSAGTPGDRGVVTAVHSASPSPVPRASDPRPPSADNARERASEVVDAEIVDEPNDLVSTQPVENLPAFHPNAIEPNAGNILAAWIDHCRTNDVQLTKRVIGHYAKRIKEAVDQGFHPNLIKTALANMLAEGVAGKPSYLDNHLVQAQNGPQRRPRRLTPGEDSVMRLTDNGTNAEVIDLFKQMLRPA